MIPLMPSKAASIIRLLFSNKKDVKREIINQNVKSYYEEEVGTEKYFLHTIF